MRRNRIASLVNLAVVLLVASAARADRAVRPVVTSAGMDFQVAAAHGALTLKVSTPGGLVWQRSFRAEEPVSFALFDARGGRLPDGEYRWEIVAAPRTPATRAADGVAGKATDSGWIESGAFRVTDGAVLGEFAEPAQTKPAAKMQDPGNKDIVTADDEIIQGSLCVGLDCVVNENFGFDTIRMKENNTRVKFDDTSTTTGFANHDWQLTANDSPSGGANKFSIEDISASTVPFTITGSAPTNSLFVDSAGRVGLGTSTPVLKLSLLQGDTPAIRLEQTNAAGYTAQTWDIAGNEANFFVRDVTSGSRLPLRIRPGAATSTLDISADSRVGVGTASPAYKLHVFDTSAPAATAAVATFENNQGDVRVFWSNSSGTPSLWGASNIGGNFRINKSGGPANPAFELQGNGNLTIGGSLTQNSDRDSKDVVAAVLPDSVLAKVAALPISTWHYKADDAGVRHLGPMAQDFAAAFGLGADDRHISPLDAAGVSLAAIQALNERLQQKDSEIARLNERLARLEAALEKLAGGTPPR